MPKNSRFIPLPEVKKPRSNRVKSMTQVLLTPEEHRLAMRLSQSHYWSLFGCTQSGGSRFENGRPVPMPVAMLLALYESKKITAEDLLEARTLVEGTGLPMRAE